MRKLSAKYIFPRKMNTSLSVEKNKSIKPRSLFMGNDEMDSFQFKQLYIFLNCTPVTGTPSHVVHLTPRKTAALFRWTFNKCGEKSR